MKKNICFILIILILSFSITPCFADNGIMTLATSTRWTSEQMLENGAVGYSFDTYLDNSFNILTYLEYLKSDNSHVCSSFNNNWCDVLNYYDLFLSKYSEVGSSYNYYVILSGSGNYRTFIYVFSDVPIFYKNDRFLSDSTLDSDIFYFKVSMGLPDSDPYIIYPRNGSGTDTPSSVNLATDVSNLLLSNSDVYDNNGNLIFEKNIGIEEPEEETEGLIIDTLKDFLRWAILPSDDFFSAWKDEQLNKIDALDNVLTYPFSLLVRFGDTVFSLAEEEDPKICWVDVEFSVKNEKYHLLDKGCFHFNSILENDKFDELYSIYLLFVKFVLISMFVSLCIKKWNSIFNKGG